MGKTSFRTKILAFTTLAAMIILSVSAANAEQLKWKFSSYTQPNNRILGVAQKWWCSELEKRSYGQITVKIYWSDELCGPKDMMGTVKSGLADVVGHAPSYAPGETPMMNVAWLPFVSAKRADHNALTSVLLARESQPLKDEMAKFNCVFGGLMNAPLVDIISKKPVRHLEDLRSLRVRAFVTIGEVLRQVGAVPVMVPGPEMYTALDRGMVDAIATPFGIMHLWKLDEVGKYITLDMDMGDAPCFFLINKKSYDALPENLKKIIQDLIEETPALAWKLSTDAAFMKECWDAVEKNKIQVFHFPKKDREQLVEKAKAAWEEWAKKSGNYNAAKAVLTDVLRIRDDVVAQYPEGVPGGK